MAGYSYVRPKRNDLRFVPWNKLGRSMQLAASDQLRYTKETWDVMGSNPIENLRWSDLSDEQKDAASELGYENEVSWNCWMNNWESFSWKQLYTLELTPYLQSLGWDMHSWNAQYSDPPMVRRGKWRDLTVDQQRDATQLCYYKSSYDRLDVSLFGPGYAIAKPSDRFVPWEDIDETLRVQLEQSMGYTELTWNVLRLAPVEQKGWFEFMYYEKDTATALGLDDASWNCWINHYDSYGWSDLVKKGHDTHYVGLGWSEEAWDGAADPPASEGTSWKDLTEVELMHAIALCYAGENWDRIDMTRNDGPFPFSKPILRYTVWDELSDEQQLSAANVLLYEEGTWNDVGRADIEKRAWDDLTEYQKPYAVQLGLYQRTWDCFQNHYRATKWDELSEDVSNAAITLGWDTDSWSRWSGEPAVYGKKWGQLDGNERSAAYDLCHFGVTWPGNGFSINLANQYGNDPLENDANRLVLRSILQVILAISVAGLFV